MRKVAIETELDCQRALERIAELAGCLEDTVEELELRALTQAVSAWETQRWGHILDQPND
jgi:hypothetical protein